jgi:hypothetical protein
MREATIISWVQEKKGGSRVKVIKVTTTLIMLGDISLGKFGILKNAPRLGFLLLPLKRRHLPSLSGSGVSLF